MKASDIMVDISTEPIAKKLKIVSKHLKALANELEGADSIVQGIDLSNDEDFSTLSISKVGINKGDVIVVRPTMELSEEHTKKIINLIESVFPDNRILMVPSGLNLSIIDTQGDPKKF